MKNDTEYMKRALELAERGFGKTSPNPMVGAVIVKNGRILGEGYHKKCGTPHAEVNAINSLTESAEGATIYVTLEPCSTTGRTPPCTEAIIAAKLAKVVIGSLDPNPDHAGRAVDILNQAGIETLVGVEESRCLELNRAFFYWIQTGKPYLILKMAMTLDGKTATSNGNSKWITGSAARKSVQKLRQWADAVMVGGETVRADSPSLNVRDTDGNPMENWPQPTRIVASRTMTPEDAAAIMGLGSTPFIVSADSAEEWSQQMKQLGSRNITALLVEGGSELAASLLDAGIVNEVAFYIAPKILGGKNSRPVIGGRDPFSLDEALELKDTKIEQVGRDVLITGKIT